MDSALREQILSIASDVHRACAFAAGGSEGNCKNATLALALALEPLGVPVAICQGQVVAGGGVEHDHYWCRVEGVVVDPTADQFCDLDGPLVAAEEAVPQYRESSFFVFTPSSVMRLARAAGVSFPF